MESTLAWRGQYGENALPGPLNPAQHTIDLTQDDIDSTTQGGLDTPAETDPDGGDESDSEVDSISRALGRFISSDSSTFTAGGVIPIYDTATSRAEALEAASSNVHLVSPVVLRWDSVDGAGAPVQFPIQNEQHEASFAELVRTCAPAGFGRGGQDVMDPEYRTAIKMDNSQFATNLCPYALGIMDQVTRMLLPNVQDQNREGVKPRSIIVAELYKLNIYQGPSGFFKSHVDTPRKQSQFASLVICLPCRHDGGRLTVRHGGHEVSYDWDSPKAMDAIQWAAFYSDCEHEVQQVTSGHRVTLTYNLYSFPRPYDRGNYLTTPPAPVQIANLPLYKKMQEALANDKFMKKGGTLGIYSQYAYPTSSDCFRPPKHDGIVLKGGDMALYSIFQHLNLQVAVRAILPDRSEMDGFKDEFDDYDSDDYDSDGSFIEKAIVPLVGRNPGRVRVVEDGLSEEGPEWIEKYYQPRPDIKWITKSQWPGLGMVHGTYGNEAGMGWVYTYTALLVDIPPVSQRQGRQM